MRVVYESKGDTLIWDVSSQRGVILTKKGVKLLRREEAMKWIREHGFSELPSECDCYACVHERLRGE
jgi:hypothetical protein